MVKGISRQVIVVKSPDPKLFEQAIFILKEDAIGEAGITDELLLKEAKKIIRGTNHTKRRGVFLPCVIWACGGAMVTGIAWLIAALI